jgi:16S rRNA (cytosine1402-N4)-methyltransferase
VSDVKQLDHTPVMVDEVMAHLRPEHGGVYWDLTVGAGGHLRAYLERAPAGTRACGLDGDPQAIERSAHPQAELVHGNLAELDVIARDAGWPAPKAVLIDAGLSSPQVDDPERGFSYRLDGPLDMRMDPTRGVPASEWLEQITQKELADTLRELGGERFSGRIARVIKESLPLTTTTALAAAVMRAVRSHKSRSAHPARRTFQAVRMAVNQELQKLDAGLDAAINRLEPGGRVCVLSYHSGEDRTVKIRFRSGRQAGELTLLTKKPETCSTLEAEGNSRARSVKLRAAEKAMAVVPEQLEY